MIGRMISGFIVVLIGSSLLSAIAKEVRLEKKQNENINHRQTYEEYVEERLKVEREMK